MTSLSSSKKKKSILTSTNNGAYFSFLFFWFVLIPGFDTAISFCFSFLLIYLHNTLHCVVCVPEFTVPAAATRLNEKSSHPFPICPTIFY